MQALKYSLIVMIIVTFWFFLLYSIIPPPSGSRSTPPHVHRVPEIIKTNIAVVIPSAYNDLTSVHLERLLNNILYIPIQITTNNYLNKVFYPSEIIISMSSMSEYNKKSIDDIIEKFKNKYNMPSLKIYYHFQTMYSSQNRNYGIAKVNPTSKYISFFDIDDIMHPQRIAILYHILNNNDNSIDLLFHSFIMGKGCRNASLNKYVDNIENNDINLHKYYYQPFYKHHATILTQKQISSLKTSIDDNDIYQKTRCLAQQDLNSNTSIVGCDDIKKELHKSTAFKESFQFEMYRNSKFRRENVVLFPFNNTIKQSFYYMSLINYGDLISNRCQQTKFYKDSSCPFSTVSFGHLEEWDDEYSITRHANGWVTVKYDVALNIKYNESKIWNHRGEDVRFITDCYTNKYNVFHLLYHLGIYCRNNLNGTK